MSGIASILNGPSLLSASTVQVPQTDDHAPERHDTQRKNRAGDDKVKNGAREAHDDSRVEIDFLDADVIPSVYQRGALERLQESTR